MWPKVGLRIPDKAVRMVFAMIRGERKLVSRQPSDKLTALEREVLTLFARAAGLTPRSPRRGATAR